jgi:hypothetical protein
MKIRKTSIANFAKRSFFIPSLVLILVAVGWFFLLTRESATEEGSEPVEWSQREDYKIEETSEGTFIENEKAGITFKVPDGWEIEMGDDIVNMLSKKIEKEDSYGNISPEELIEKEICLVTFNSAKFQENSDSYDAINTINDLIRSCEENNETGNYEKIEIDRNKALKERKENSYFASVRIPIKNRLHYFDLYVYSEKKEDCLNEFEDILKTASINNF